MALIQRDIFATSWLAPQYLFPIPATDLVRIRIGGRAPAGARGRPPGMMRMGNAMRTTDPVPLSAVRERRLTPDDLGA